MKRLLLLLLLLPSLAWAQKPPINGVAGPTTSDQLRSIITDATGSGPLNFGIAPCPSCATLGANTFTGLQTLTAGLTITDSITSWSYTNAAATGLIIPTESRIFFTGNGDGTADVRGTRSIFQVQGAQDVAQLYGFYTGVESAASAGTVPRMYGNHNYVYLRRAGNITLASGFFSHAALIGSGSGALASTGTLAEFRAYEVGATAFDLTPGTPDTSTITLATGYYVGAIGSQILRVGTSRGVWLTDTTALNETTGIYSEQNTHTNPAWFIKHVGTAPSYLHGPLTIDRQNGGGTNERVLLFQNTGTLINTGLTIDFDLGGNDNSRAPQIQAINPVGGGYFGSLKFNIVNGAPATTALLLAYNGAHVMTGSLTLSGALTVGGAQTLGGALGITGSITPSAATTYNLGGSSFEWLRTYTRNISTTETITNTAGTITGNQPVIEGTQTWNNAAITFFGSTLSITPTAYNANSRLVVLNVSGSPMFSVDVLGNGLFGASVKTGAPSGSTAQAWKLGAIQSGAVVVNTTRSVYVDIAGAVYKFIIAQ